MRGLCRRLWTSRAVAFGKRHRDDFGLHFLVGTLVSPGQVLRHSLVLTHCQPHPHRSRHRRCRAILKQPEIFQRGNVSVQAEVLYESTREVDMRRDRYHCEDKIVRIFLAGERKG